MEVIALAWAAVQLAGLIAGLVLTGGKHERDKRFEGERLGYRS